MAELSVREPIDLGVETRCDRQLLEAVKGGINQEYPIKVEQPAWCEPMVALLERLISAREQGNDPDLSSVASGLPH